MKKFKVIETRLTTNGESFTVEYIFVFKTKKDLLKHLMINTYTFQSKDFKIEEEA